MIPHENIPPGGYFRHVRRILLQPKLQMIIYLGGTLLHRSCGSLGSVSCHSNHKLKLADPSAALHAGKDLAVSPAWLPKRLFPKEFPCFRLRRLCSHLACHHGRALPATVLLVTQDVSGRSSPQSEAIIVCKLLCNIARKVQANQNSEE